MLLPQMFLHILIKSLPKHDNLQTLCSKYIKFVSLSTYPRHSKISQKSQTHPRRVIRTCLA